MYISSPPPPPPLPEELQIIERTGVFYHYVLEDVAKKFGNNSEFLRDFLDATRIEESHFKKFSRKKIRVGAHVLFYPYSIFLLSDICACELLVSDDSAENGLPKGRCLHLVTKDRGTVHVVDVPLLDSFLFLAKTLLSRGITLRCRRGTVEIEPPRMYPEPIGRPPEFSLHYTDGTDEKEWTKFSPVSIVLAWYGCSGEPAEHADLLASVAEKLETSSNCCARQCAKVLKSALSSSFAPLSEIYPANDDEELLEQVLLRLTADTELELESAHRLLDRVSFASDTISLRAQVNEALIEKRREREEKERREREWAEKKRKAEIKRLRIAFGLTVALFIFVLALMLASPTREASSVGQRMLLGK